MLQGFAFSGTGSLLALSSFGAFVLAALFGTKLFAQPSASLSSALKPPPLCGDSLSTRPFLERYTTNRGEKVFVLYTLPVDSLKLPDEFIFRGSEKIFFDGLPVDSTRYRIDDVRGILYLRYLFRDSLLHRLEVRYRALPFSLKREYLRREILFQTARDSLLPDMLAARKPKAPLLQIDDIFAGTSLRRSGSLVRGITVGSNQDLNVTSGLRLQLEGTLAPGVEIAAALTDENTPIQPEGNTQTLQEFDRVFVEVKAEKARATIGDFNLSLGGTEFANLERRLQGGKVEGTFNFSETSSISTLLSFANARGRFHTNQFNGRDGVQGPYRLTGPNGEPFIIVLAGTERVYVNGELMVRGQNNDYVIEYATGEIYFQPRRLITQQSRITVDFQFTERLYPRNFLTSKTVASLFDDRLRFQASFISESDDENSPIDFLLTERGRESLRQAGADRLRATDTTAFVGVDSLGRPRGAYVKIDTVIQGERRSIFRFVGEGAPYAFWNPPFSIVPEGQGSYRRLNFGIYEYVGEGLGNYVPFALLPLPTAQNVLDLSLQLSPVKGLSFSLEGALSQNDLNKFSPLDDSLRDGRAYTLSATFSPQSFELFGVKLGDFDLRLSQRETSRQFAFIDRTLPVDLNRDFNLIDFDGRLLFTAQAAERLRSAFLTYKPIRPLAFSYRLGQLERETLFSALRQEVGLQLRLDSLLSVTYSSAHTASQNALTAENANWVRHSGQLGVELRPASGGFWSFLAKPFFNLELSEKDTRAALTDTLRPDSHKILDAVVGISLTNFLGQNLSASFGYRTDELFDSQMPFGASLIPASAAHTLSAEWQLLPSSDFLAFLNFTHRVRRFSERFRERGNSDVETFLLRFQTRYTPFRAALELEWLYDVSTEQTSRLERRFFAVPLGRGNFIWRDRNGNGLREFDEFIPVTFIGEVGDDNLQYILRTFPSDELFPTIDLRTSLRFRLRPARFFSQRESLFEHILSALSSESLFRVEERSTERELSRIYLLDFSRFQNDSTTLVGAFTVQQDIFLFETELTNLRLRFQQRSSLNQFSLGVERRLFVERSLRAVSRIGYSWGIELNFFSTLHRSFASALEGRDFGGISRQFFISGIGLSADISYRPIQDLELGIRTSYEWREDTFPASRIGQAALATLNTQQLRAIYSLRGKGRISAQLERTEATLSGISPFEAVFELTNGNPFGTTLLWRIDVDYRVSNFITASAGYDGRALPTGRIIHTGRAEVRAVF
ncbi:MAG: hypothetical protein NZ844_12170 [Chloroherpetonaceae bacterium]|nr:hypothetical protein [Chloroherpetonaceae bacterium]